jgi:tetratricopeptide (TPR) repeat protein
MHGLTRVAAVGALLLWSVAASAQARSSPDAQRATRHYQAAWELMKAEQWERASSEFQQAIDIDPKFALAHYGLGRSLVNQKKFAAAIVSYLKCRDLYVARAGEKFSNQIDANRALDDQILEMNDYLTKVFKGTATERQHLELQLSQMREARQRGNGVPVDLQVPYFVSLALGTAYFRAERFDDAERELKAAIDANSAAAEAHNNLAVVYLYTKRYEDAAREITAAEKAGFKVNPGLKDEIKAKLGK